MSIGGERKKYEQSKDITKTDEGRRLYWVWSAMIQRCHNKNSKGFAGYGGRGISVCDRWRKSFRAFCEDMGERPKKWTIERVNNDLGYSPENCRWASYSDQAKNRPGFCSYAEVDGVIACFKDVWRSIAPADVSYRAAKKRYEKGWGMGEAIVRPAMRHINGAQ